MKLPKFLLILVCITLVSLIYIRQQTKILRLAYLGQKKAAVCQDLLDKNSVLRYNVGKNISLVCIDNKVSGLDDFQMPDSYRLVRLALPGGSESTLQGLKRETLVSRLFGIKRQAEAGTINP